MLLVLQYYVILLPGLYLRCPTAVCVAFHSGRKRIPGEKGVGQIRCGFTLSQVWRKSPHTSIILKSSVRNFSMACRIHILAHTSTKHKRVANVSSFFYDDSTVAIMTQL